MLWVNNERNEHPKFITNRSTVHNHSLSFEQPKIFNPLKSPIRSPAPDQSSNSFAFYSLTYFVLDQSRIPRNPLNSLFLRPSLIF
ncbi:hypothetical protein Pst134EA_011626 [Puccinia striiformis f. sp. tritici]|uniref:hypothetical protein n=1 Tax=Puccinia striiformis f. sp. tritici TaxID=168172 RepID=UPI00200877B4|nr:hypothetical protein Pst134EA_011626 [Puccinia striiformis f. sp. tritici]KAH9468004.1 hypothetical protein Pst134EA_011626 [Puccinia striiformis f. sp. tritici]